MASKEQAIIWEYVTAAASYRSDEYDASRSINTVQLTIIFDIFWATVLNASATGESLCCC